MILETTNPKYLTASQNWPVHQVVVRPGMGEAEWCSQSSREMSKPGYTAHNFKDRAPDAIPNREPEPRAIRQQATSLRLKDEAPDAPLWLIIDRITGHILARVRGSLPYIVFQCRIVAAHMGGDFSDLYYRKEATQ